MLGCPKLKPRSLVFHVQTIENVRQELLSQKTTLEADMKRYEANLQYFRSAAQLNSDFVL